MADTIKNEEMAIVNDALHLLSRNLWVYAAELGVFMVIDDRDRAIRDAREEQMELLFCIIDRFAEISRLNKTEPRIGGFDDRYPYYTYRTERGILPLVLKELTSIRGGLTRLRNQCKSTETPNGDEVLETIDDALEWSARAIEAMNALAEGICEPAEIADPEASLEGLIKVK